MASRITYPGDGTLYVIPFPYLDPTHVKVEVGGVLLATDAYSFPTSGSVQLVTDPGSADVTIYRETPQEALTVYQSGSVLSRGDLETDSKQALYRIEEVESDLGDSKVDVDFLPDPSALQVIGWDALGTALRNFELGTSDGSTYSPTTSLHGVDRTVQDRLRDFVRITDHGGSATPGFDNSPALAKAYAEAVLTGKGIEYPAGTFEHLTRLTMTTVVPIKVAGYGRTWIKCADTVWIEYANSVKPVYMDLISGGCRFTGPGAAVADSAAFYFTSASVGSSFCNWRDMQVGSVESFWLSDAPPADSGTATNRFAGVVNWSTFENISLRGGIKYGARFRKGSGTGNCWVGGKPGIDQSGGAVVECLGAPAADNNMEGINVGDLFFLGVHALTEQAVSADAVFFRGGPDTTYRSRIGFFGCQFDAKQDIPMDLSTVGSQEWSNIRLPEDNNIGGAVNIYDHIPPLARSIVVDQGMSRHESQFNTTRTAGASPVAYTDNIFKIALGVSTGTRVSIDVSGAMGSYGSYAGHWQFSIRRGATTPTVEEISEWVNGDVSIGLDVTTTTAADGTVLFVLHFTAGLSPGAVTVDAQLETRGGTVKVQNGRYL